MNFLDFKNVVDGVLIGVIVALIVYISRLNNTFVKIDQQLEHLREKTEKMEDKMSDFEDRLLELLKLVLSGGNRDE